MIPKITCIIQARTESLRLAGKVLLKLGKKTVLQYLIERLKKSKNIDSFILATTKKKKKIIQFVNLLKNKRYLSFVGMKKMY